MSLLVDGSKARAGFDLDLKYGKEAENQLLKILLASGTRVEVKRDEKCLTTGNLFIEFSYRGRPSGIATTEAEWWAFRFRKDRYLLIFIDDLKDYVERAKKEGLVRSGGDFNQSEGVVVPIRWLIKE